MIWLLFCLSMAWAQDPVAEPAAPTPGYVIGLGAAQQYQSTTGVNYSGFNLIADLHDPLDRFRLEGGGIFSSLENGTETVVYLLFKLPLHWFKPLDLAIGVGPEMSKSANDRDLGTNAAFMAAVTAEYFFTKRWGLALEPDLQYIFRRGGEVDAGAVFSLVYTH